MSASRALISKINALPNSRLGEVEKFVDYIQMDQMDRQTARDLARASEASFTAVWENDADSVYDAL